MSGTPFHGYVRSDKHPRYYTDKLIERLGGDPSAPTADILYLLISHSGLPLGYSAWTTALQMYATANRQDD